MHALEGTVTNYWLELVFSMEPIVVLACHRGERSDIPIMAFGIPTVCAERDLWGENQSLAVATLCVFPYLTVILNMQSLLPNFYIAASSSSAACCLSCPDDVASFLVLDGQITLRIAAYYHPPTPSLPLKFVNPSQPTTQDDSTV